MASTITFNNGSVQYAIIFRNCADYVVAVVDGSPRRRIYRSDIISIKEGK